METVEKMEKRTLRGHVIKRLRQTLGIKQEALASDLGITQQTISSYEHKPVIEDDILGKFAKALNVSTDLIKKMEEDPLTIIFENNNIETNHGTGYVAVYNSPNHYNPVEKIVELCEKLLEREQEKITLLEKLLKEKG